MQKSNIDAMRRFEGRLFAAGALVGLAFLLFIAFVLIVPVGNHLRAAGTIQFRGEQTLVSEVEGVIAALYKRDHDSVSRGQPVLKVVDEDRKAASKSLDYRIAYLRAQLGQLRKLEVAGALDRVPAEAKLLELQQSEQEKSRLERVAVNATLDGYLTFLNPPEDLVGTYLRRGDVVGYIYRSPEKVVEVELPGEWVDRFTRASSVLVYYKDPLSYLSRILPAAIESIHENKEEHKFQITCRLESPKEVEAFLRPGTVVRVSFLVNSTSIFEEAFGIDPYGLLMARLSGSPIGRAWKAPALPGGATRP